jgi:esterase/lipase superfamily enzyme
MAPDIDAGVFRSLTSAMRTAADRVTLYASSRDKALIVSERLNHGLRAGQSGANLIITPGIDTVDASAVKTDAFAFDHSYYADNIVVLSDLYHLFRGDPPETRFGLERVEIDRGIYWRFRPYVR